MRRSGRPLSVLLVDNHDSYTWNLYQLLWYQLGLKPDVVESDSDSLDHVPRSKYSHIVIGPGPGTPHDQTDAGKNFELMRSTDAPILGVCFGFQLLSVALGATVGTNPAPAHGVVSTIRRHDSMLFAGMPRTFKAVRYHSLRVEEPLPPELTVTSRSEDDVVMSGECSELGLFGVQFHPESIGTEHGAQLIGNFLSCDARSNRRQLEVAQ